VCVARRHRDLREASPRHATRRARAAAVRAVLLETRMVPSSQA